LLRITSGSLSRSNETLRLEIGVLSSVASVTTKPDSTADRASDNSSSMFGAAIAGSGSGSARVHQE